MAKTPAAVRELLMRVWAPARAKALADAAVLEAMLQADGHFRAAGALGLALLFREAAQGRA
jgi:Zn-dependent oligopeptidase